jgi:hypothetical protein
MSTFALFSTSVKFSEANTELRAEHAGEIRISVARNHHSRAVTVY